MNFFFDNNTPPVLASTIAGFLAHTEHNAYHIRNLDGSGLHLRSGAPDREWITALGRASDDWVVVTADRRISTNPGEREAFRRARIKAILLPAATRKRKFPANEQASLLLLRWPELIDTLDRFEPPIMLGLPLNRTGKLKNIQW